MKRKLVIAGSRDLYPSPQEIDYAVVLFYDRYRPETWIGPVTDIQEIYSRVELVCGMAKGADQAGLHWAKSHQIYVHEYPANWSSHGGVAGRIRNRTMAQVSDDCIVFWDGMSGGSCDMATRMLARDKPVMVISRSP